MGDVERHEAMFPMGTQVSSKGRWRHCRPAGPKWIVSGMGAKVWDEQGREYLDLVAGLGAITLGHESPRLSCHAYPLPTRAELVLGDKIQELCPLAKKMRFLKNGGDATCAAVRLARVYTGRTEVLDFGNYHGCQDFWLDKTQHEGGGADVASRTPIHHYGYCNTADYAAVILEALPINPLPDGFLRKLREDCTRSGTVLIFDDVISGFRAHPAGAAGITGVEPDLVCAGKAMGNGWPISVVYGNPDIMDCWSRTHLSATHWAEPAAMEAAVANLEYMKRQRFWDNQKYWSFGGQKNNGYWSVLSLPPAEATLVQRQLLHAGIISNLSQFYYAALDEHKARVEQAFADALGLLAKHKADGKDIASLLDCDVNITTFRRNQ